MRSLLVAFVLSSCLVGAHASAGEVCRHVRGERVCEVGIPSERLTNITAAQHRSQWCWAASIAMIFAFHGHPVSQEQIVKSVYGRLADLPAFDGDTMTDALARPWTDARGRAFRARVRVFDEASGHEELDVAGVINELRNERPLLVGTVGHAMVMTALRYVDGDDGPEIVGITVRDPWPGEGRRELAWHEMSPSYVAAVKLGQGVRTDN